jgi:Zn-dependent M16 (insulinase) family peptidase
VHEAGQASMLVRLFMWPFDCLESMRFKGMYGCAQMRTVLQDVEFNDQQRFNQFVARSKSHMESQITGGGHVIAAACMCGMLNVAGWVSEQMGGLSYLEYSWDLEKRVDEDWPAVAESLEADCFACMEGCHCEFDSR